MNKNLKIYYFAHHDAIELPYETLYTTAAVSGHLPSPLVVAPGVYTLWNERGGGFLFKKGGCLRFLIKEKK